MHRYGTATVTACMEELLDYSERREDPHGSGETSNGVHTFSDYPPDGVVAVPNKPSVIVGDSGSGHHPDHFDNPTSKAGPSISPSAFAGRR